MIVKKTFDSYIPPQTFETDLKVGSKVTIIYYSDREPATVVKMSKSGNKITVRKNKAKRIGEFYSNDWEISDEFEGPEMTYHRHKDGEWYSKDKGTFLYVFGHYKYFDYSF